MAITNLPTPPSRSDPENFPERADAFMAALPGFATEANLLLEQASEAAIAADADASVASASKNAAVASQNQAAQSAQAADASRQISAEKANDAGASAQLAQQWATKMGAPVEGDGFSAKHYAKLAEAGTGLTVYSAGDVPSENIGPIYIKGQGVAEWDTFASRYEVRSKIAVGTPSWWPSRVSIPAGQIPLDGQVVSRATFPDLAAMVIAGMLPVVAEAAWQSDPTQRGMYTLGDGSTTIRVPDMNGKAAGSLGAVFRRGDGEMSAGTNGLIQRDALQNLTGAMTTRSGAGGVGALVSSSGAFQSATKATGSGIGFIAYAAGDGAGDQTTFDASRVARTAAETRPLNVTGVWTVHAFGAVVNPGSVDAAQLASDLAALDAELQTLVGQIEFTIIYPNGGSEASPANIAINSQYVLTNPFPGHHVILEPEVLYEGNWGNPGWWSGDANMAGIRATMRNNSIILSTAKNALGIGYPLGGGAFTYTGSTGIGVAGLPARIKVWKVKGAVA
ncbi:hypothetical protein D3C85_868830 [compost metagenome]